VAAQLTGSVGLAGSANIGQECAMFEAIHGSAPRRAGQDVANPSGLLQGAVLMLNHIGQSDVAEAVQNAWLYTIEEGIHTYDIFKEGLSTQLVGTRAFADAIIRNLGKKPAKLTGVSYADSSALNLPAYVRKPAANKELLGVDLFVHWRGTNPDELAKSVQQLNLDEIKLFMITNRGIKVWPEGFQETFCTDHWRCRFKHINGGQLSKQNIIRLMEKAILNQIDVVKSENLYAFDGKPAFSLGQGQ
jgi:isocitrate dehydrogenase